MKKFVKFEFSIYATLHNTGRPRVPDAQKSRGDAEFWHEKFRRHWTAKTAILASWLIKPGM